MPKAITYSYVTHTTWRNTERKRHVTRISTETAQDKDRYYKRFNVIISYRKCNATRISLGTAIQVRNFDTGIVNLH